MKIKCKLCGHIMYLLGMPIHIEWICENCGQVTNNYGTDLREAEIDIIMSEDDKIYFDKEEIEQYNATIKKASEAIKDEYKPTWSGRLIKPKRPGSIPITDEVNNHD